VKNDPLMMLAKVVEVNTKSIGQLREMMATIDEIQTKMIEVLKHLGEAPPKKKSGEIETNVPIHGVKKGKK